MLKRLKSALKSQTSQLVFKSAILSILLYFSANSLFFALFFGALALIFYFSPIFSWKEYAYSFAITFVLALVFINKEQFLGAEWLFLASLVFGALFFMILGIKNLVFIKRQEVYYFLNSALFFLIFLAFLSLNNSEFYGFKYFFAFFLSFFGIFMLFKEFLGYHKTLEQYACLFSAKSNLLAISLAFLTMQFLWIISLLPIGFFNASAFVLVIILAIKDLLVNHIEGTLGRESVLKNMTIVIIFGLIIFAVSNWQL